MYTVCANVTEAINYSINRSPRAREENTSTKSREIRASTSFSLIGFGLDEHFKKELLRQSEEFKNGMRFSRESDAELPRSTELLSVLVSFIT